MPTRKRAKQPQYLGMSPVQLCILAGLGVLLVMTLGVGALFVVSSLSNSTPQVANAPVQYDQASTSTAYAAALAFPTLPPSFTPTFTKEPTLTKTPSNTPTATATDTPYLSPTPLPSATLAVTDIPPPTNPPRPTVTSQATRPVAPTVAGSTGFQYQFSYRAKYTYRGPVEAFGYGSLRVRYTFSGAPDDDTFAVVIQRQYDQQVTVLDEAYGSSGEGVADFALPAAGDYVFVISSMAEAWQVDIYFMAN